MLDQVRLSSDFASEPGAHAQPRALLAPYFSGRNIGALQAQVAR
jgi:cytochrome P450